MWKRKVAMLLCACLLTGGVACGAAGKQENDTEDRLVSGVDSEEKDRTMNEDGENLELATDASADLDMVTPSAGKQIFKTVNLMERVEPVNVGYDCLQPDSPIMKFGLPLFQKVFRESKVGENMLVSPVSAMLALQMTTMGAVGDTKSQMADVLGDNTYSAYMTYFAKELPQGKGYKVNVANGIWYKNVESLHVKDSFLQYNKRFYDAAAYKAPFHEDTLKEINDWVAENTDGMIPGILDEISENEIMYLINALSFDAEWQQIYNESDIWKDIFTTENGTEQLVPMMHTKESVYLEDELATGFMKYYKDEKYAFVALLPKEGVTVADYVENLTAEHLQELLSNPVRVSVETTLPKFETEYSVSLNEILQQMGIKDAFSENDADFSAMATSDVGNIFISRVLQKTFISVDERGTKAGAATAVAMANKAMLLDKKVVNLNRPFVYLIVECEYNEPLFIGTMMDVENIAK